MTEGYRYYGLERREEDWGGVSVQIGSVTNERTMNFDPEMYRTIREATHGSEAIQRERRTGWRLVGFRK